MQKKKHHFTKKQTNALVLSALATAAAFQLASCTKQEYIPDHETTLFLTEAIASDTVASALRTEPVDMAPMDREELVMPETSTAEETAATTEKEILSAEETTTLTEETTTEHTTAEETKKEESFSPKFVFETKYAEEYRDIPYGTQYIYSDDYEEGESFVSREGKVGQSRIVITQTYRNGELYHTETEEYTVYEAVSRVITVGTKPKLSTKVITQTEDVLPFATVYEYDDARYDDEISVLEEGSDGYTLREYRITYRGTEEISREMISENVVPMIPKRILVGTKPAATTETITQTEHTVPYETEYVYDDTLDAGIEFVRQAGVDGYTLATYRITYYHGEETGRELVETVSYEMQTEIIVIGTKEEETFGLPYIDAAHGGVDYNITQHYGNNGHGGMDIAVWYGDPIVSIKSGTVIAAYDEGDFGKDNILWTYGTYVVVEHDDGVRSYYAHLSDRTVSVGDTVGKGEVIGHSGNTGRVNPMPDASNPLAGTHLHFEIRVWNGYGYSTTDPRDYLPGWWGG